MNRVVTLFVVVSIAACGADNPTAPTRHGPPFLLVTCTAASASPLTCTARVACSLYPCAPGTPTDVTTMAAWESADDRVVRVVGPGWFDAAGLGNTVVRGRWERLESERPVGVFPGSPPLPTHEIFGAVYEPGRTVADAPIARARVEIVGGWLSGRAAITGMPPSPLPGFSGLTLGPASYRLLGVPLGTYRVRVTGDGYVPQERDVVVSVGSTAADFQLQPSS